MNKRNWRQGFTLVEVLVVVAIIGILSAVIFAGFGDSRDSAKNTAFQAHMKETQLAIELYKAQYGRYPEPNLSGGGGCRSTAGPTESSNDGGNCPTPIILGPVAPATPAPLVPDFIADLPRRLDSANPNCVFWYTVADDGSFYKLTAANCFAGAIQSDDELARYPSTFQNPGAGNQTDPADIDFYESLAIYSSGGEGL